LRVALSLAALPSSTVKWPSAIVAGLIGVVYYVVPLQTQGFGGSRHLPRRGTPIAWVENGSLYRRVRPRDN